MELFDHQLDKNIPVPLYYQLKTLLEEYIEKEHTNYEEPIPTEMEISEAFGISRPTVRQAINSLVVEGKLYRKKSKGTFVNRPKIHQNFLESIQSFNEEMKEKGLTPKTEVLGLEVVACDEEVGRALQLEMGAELGMTIDYATRRLEAILADSSTAKILGISKGSAIQYIQTIAYLTDETTVEYSKAYYRGDRSHFTFKLKRN